ncbi:MAG: PilW family protein [Oxalobacteraceae bacterium]|nr:PilW family protein [Oxalobacteraceae bacterium]
MTSQEIFLTARRQRGVGLIEVMISLVIGLVLLGALAYFFLGSQQMNRTHDDVSRMQESGRNAMEVLGNAIRQAGYRLDVDQPMNGVAITGANGTGTGAAALPDTITIRHDPTWVADAANPLKGIEANCAGGLLTSDNDTFDSLSKRVVNTKQIEYVFSIASGALRCTTKLQDATNTTETLVDNVENMQITYGIGDGNGAITLYKAAPSAAEFTQVAAVRVSLLVKGPTPNVAVNNSQAYNYNGEDVTATDGFLRQVYTSTFTVRNQTK